MQESHIAESCCDRHLGTGGQRSWPWKVTAVDGIAQHDVQSWFGGRRTEATGEPRIQHTPCVGRGPQHVFFRQNETKFYGLADVGESQVGWASISPGINVRPTPSTTVAPGTTVSVRSCGTTAVIRLPSTRTHPLKGFAPVQSRMLTF